MHLYSEYQKQPNATFWIGSSYHFWALPANVY
jgi:hypothetical protein